MFETCTYFAKFLHATSFFLHNSSRLQIFWLTFYNASFSFSLHILSPVGGIYTVIQTKARITVDEWGENYFMMGPYYEHNFKTQVEPCEPPNRAIKVAMDSLINNGCQVFHNRAVLSGASGLFCVAPAEFFII